MSHLAQEVQQWGGSKRAIRRMQLKANLLTLGPPAYKQPLSLPKLDKLADLVAIRLAAKGYKAPLLRFVTTIGPDGMPHGGLVLTSKAQFTALQDRLHAQKPPCMYAVIYADFTRVASGYKPVSSFRTVLNWPTAAKQELNGPVKTFTKHEGPPGSVGHSLEGGADALTTLVYGVATHAGEGLGAIGVDLWHMTKGVVNGVVSGHPDSSFAAAIGGVGDVVEDVVETSTDIVSDTWHSLTSWI